MLKGKMSEGKIRQTNHKLPLAQTHSIDERKNSMFIFIAFLFLSQTHAGEFSFSYT